MSIRPLAWHDLWTLYRYRNQVLSLDSALALTRGGPFGPSAMLAHLRSESGSFTGIVSSGRGPALIGQVHYTMGERSARLACVMPQAALSSPDMPLLLEGLAVQAGGWGAFHLLAELEESSPLFENMRRAGFSVYAWQRIWRLTPPQKGVRDGTKNWQPVSSTDEIGVRSLYQYLVPPLVQSAEPLPEVRPFGLVIRRQDEVLAYLNGFFGPRGIYLQPLIHPEVQDTGTLLDSIWAHLPPLLGRPVYLVVRSYQPWLESALEDGAHQVAPRQALMVKHMALVQRLPQAVPRLATLENKRAESTTPILNHYSSQDNKQ